MSRLEDHPTRALLLEAGLRLAASQGLGQISVNAVTREAGVAKGTYYVHFPSREAFLDALYRWWHGTLTERVRAGIAGQQPGAQRLRHGVIAYLDACLHSRDVKTVMVGARGEPALARAVAESTGELLAIIAEDLTAAGHPTPGLAARLIAAMGLEAAIIELEGGGEHPPTRDCLIDMLPL